MTILMSFKKAEWSRGVGRRNGRRHSGSPWFFLLLFCIKTKK